MTDRRDEKPIENENETEGVEEFEAVESEKKTALQITKEAVDDDLTEAEGDSSDRPIKAVCVTFENHEAELIQSGEVIDEQGRSKGHKNFQILGVFLLLWMFVPNIMKDPTDLISWLMVLAAGGLLWVVMKFPARINARFAKERAEAIPECTVEISADGITVIEGPSRYEVDFSGKVVAYDYRDGITIQTETNRIVCIPKKQITEAELFDLRAALRRGLGDRFKTIDYNPKPGLLGGFGGRR